MKRALLLLLLVAGVSSTHAQWSNTTNQFYDSLDMPVAQATSDQKNPLIVKSEPDGGYFVIWEDYRNANNSDIYAQKYDKDGHRLWALNGVPVATGDAPDQQYSNISNGVISQYNYQNVSHAASDGSGGFYITWQVYLASPVSSYGVFVQHVRSNGTHVFASDGYGLAIPTVSTQRYDQPQLIGDGNGGFFIGYKSSSTSFNGNVSVVTVYCYKDEAGVLKNYGGGVMSDLINYYGAGNNYRFCSVSGTGGYLSVPVSGPTYANANSFNLFPDGQGGCGVVMVEAPTNEKCFPAFDQLCRVKKDSYVHTQDGTFFFKKDSVVQLYSSDVRNVEIDCTDATAPPGSTFYASLYTVFNQGVQNLLATRGGGINVYDPLYIGSGKFYDAYTTYAIEKINAALMPTEGNINSVLVTWNQRNYVNSQLTNWSTRGIVLAMEKYDSLPYQLCSGDIPRGLSYNGVRPAGMNKINEGKSGLDTLLAPYGASYFYDYSLTGSGSRAFVTSSVKGLTGGAGSSPFYYQEAKLIRQSADSFALKLITPPNHDTGFVIGIGTANDRFPFIAGDGAGNATFCYVGPNGRDYLKASPVEEGGKLRWGALGLPLNSGGVSGSYYYASTPFMYMDADGKAVVAWNDGRKTPDGYTGQNVYMRHLDSLLKPNYQPPLLNTQLTVTPANGTTPGRYFSQSTPQALIGTSNAWTTFQVPVLGPTSNSSTPVAAIRDDYNLGTVSVSTYDFYNQPLRRTDGRAYLDRNYTISVTNHPPGAAIHVRLIFTKAQFDSLKAHDVSIQDPGDLGVIKQPSTGVAPASYTATANDQGVRPTAWGTYFNTVDNVTSVSGYYIEVVISDFSNFFIMSAATVLPVTLQSFVVKAVDQTALLQWVTASELNNDHFDIERSVDGRVFTKIGRVQGNGTTSIPQDYSFVDAAPVRGNNYYRLAQVDLDGRVEYSQVRLLSFDGQVGKMMLSPNPVKNLLHVTLPQAASGQDLLELYNVSGLKVLVQMIPAGTLQLDADVSTQAPGVYIMRYGKASVKVVKE
ncbi:MAG: T9SS type A sorting domain-containing protein [Chitinophagaceae bacterium]|nr:MAG: T9SS type A sorting domain-containing protein [Chitinophagaceae bacterium]